MLVKWLAMKHMTSVLLFMLTAILLVAIYGILFYQQLGDLKKIIFCAIIMVADVVILSVLYLRSMQAKVDDKK